MKKRDLDPEAWRRQVRRERIVFGSILALVCLTCIVLYAYNRYADAFTRQLYVAKEAVITPNDLLLQQYIRIDTSHENEIDGAHWLAAQLTKAHVPYEIIESAPGRANLYARIRGRRPNEGLLLLSHIDVVPATRAGWSEPPFDGAIWQNQLWGRGALDMKSITICELQAFLAVAASGRTPERDLVFLAVADEEHGSGLGTRWLLEHRPDVFAGIHYAINEGGVTESVGEQINYFGVEVGTKQLVALDVFAPRREMLDRFRIALEPYFTRDFADDVPDEVARYFAAIAPVRIEPKPWLADLRQTVARGELWRLPRGYRELVQNIVWAEAVRQDEGKWAMRVSLLNLPNVQPEPRVEWLRRYAAAYGVTVGPVLVHDPVARLSSDQTPFFRMLVDHVHKQYGDAIRVGPQIMAGSANDSRFLRPRGVQAYGMWPFPVDFFQTDGIHGINERVRLDWFDDGVTLTKSLVEDYVMRPGPAV